MPSWSPATSRTPFGQNEYLRSTRGKQYESFTLYHLSVPVSTVDDATDQRVLQPGVVLARITSGGGSGMVGPYQPGTTGQESVSIPVNATAGTWTITFQGETTAAIAFNATAAAVQTAFDLLPGVRPGDFVVTGGPGSATPVPYVIATNPFGSYPAPYDAPVITTGAGSLTGGSASATVTTTAPAASEPATDGRQTATNIVGINDTFLPWQLMYRDVEVAALYAGAVVRARVLEIGADDVYLPISDATVAAIQDAVRLRNLTFH